jgi:hypothetical protein
MLPFSLNRRADWNTLVHTDLAPHDASYSSSVVVACWQPTATPCFASTDKFKEIINQSDMNTMFQKYKDAVGSQQAGHNHEGYYHRISKRNQLEEGKSAWMEGFRCNSHSSSPRCCQRRSSGRASGSSSATVPYSPNAMSMATKFCMPVWNRVTKRWLNG